MRASRQPLQANAPTAAACCWGGSSVSMAEAAGGGGCVRACTCGACERACVLRGFARACVRVCLQTRMQECAGKHALRLAFSLTAFFAGGAPPFFLGVRMNASGNLIHLLLDAAAPQQRTGRPAGHEPFPGAAARAGARGCMRTVRSGNRRCVLAPPNKQHSRPARTRAGAP